VERERGEGFSVAREVRTACRGSLGLLLFLAGVLMLPGVADGAEGARGHGASGDVIVKVDGEPVTRGDVLRRVRAAKGNIEPSTMDPEEWRRIVATATKSEIVDRLLLKAALAGGLEIDSEKLERSVGDMKEELGEARFQQVLDMRSATEEEFREFIRQRMLMEKYKAALFKDVFIGDETVRGHYEKHLDSYSLPERAKLGLMVVENEESAVAALEKLREGEDFGIVAAAHGAGGRSASEGGAKVVPIDTLPEAVKPSVMAAKTGDLLGPLQGSEGTYVIQVDEKWEAGPTDYNEISDRIRKELLERKKLAILDAWYEDEKQKAVMEYQ
jgi:parvulin-like peptidyl-prolyl isomerase